MRELCETCFDEDINTSVDLLGGNYNQWALLTLHFDWALQHVEANRETTEQNGKSDKTKFELKN